MTPLSFDAATAREVVGDQQARVIEQKARTDADKGIYEPLAFSADTYWGQVQSQMWQVVYREQFNKRQARIARKKAANE